jgi:hypothetical protein
MNSNINTFILKGVFGSYCVKDLQTAGLLRTPIYTQEERKEHDLFVSCPEKIRSGSLQMQKYFRLLYVFENLIRDFLDTTFRDAGDGESWFEKRASSEMKKKVADRKKSEERNQWHVGRNEHPLYYLDFSDLSLLIINHWPIFKDFFPDQGWVSSRIREAERTRNVIAHTNDLSAEEGTRLEMHLRDWINQVG